MKGGNNSMVYTQPTNNIMMGQTPVYNNIMPNRMAVNVNNNHIRHQATIPRKNPQAVRTIYAQKTTKNKSFLDMHHYLKSIGVKNNEFMLTLIDPDLDGIDPHDPNLNSYYKQKVLREVLSNFWSLVPRIMVT